MPKVSQEQVQARKEEIVEACSSLYETKSFKDITLVDIGKATSLSRPSIYNYFETKEEIFLALLQKEYDLWNEDLSLILEENVSLSMDDFADKVAHSLEKRLCLLKILSMNMYDMEANSRLENLTEFKLSYAKTLELMKGCIEKYFPTKDSESFIYLFFPFMFGIYPYTYATEKQKEAMGKAGIQYPEVGVYGLVSSCVKNLLDGSLSKN